MIKYIIIIGALLSSCSKIEKLMYKPYTKYKINGEIVECRMEATVNCGVSLWECKNGSVYRCLWNIQIIK